MLGHYVVNVDKAQIVFASKTGDPMVRFGLTCGYIEADSKDEDTLLLTFPGCTCSDGREGIHWNLPMNFYGGRLRPLGTPSPRLYALVMKALEECGAAEALTREVRAYRQTLAEENDGKKRPVDLEITEGALQRVE